MKHMNKLSEAAKFLIIAGTILIVCTLVVVGFMVMKEGKEGTNNSMAQFNSITSGYSDANHEKYHNLTITGSSLSDLIATETDTNNTEKVEIQYKTLVEKSSTSFTVASASTLTIKSTEAKYINPTGSFKGKVVKDANGIITRIEFTQTK